MKTAKNTGNSAINDLLAEAREAEMCSYDRKIAYCKTSLSIKKTSVAYGNLASAYKQKAMAFKKTGDSVQYQEILNLALEAMENGLKIQRTDTVLIADKLALLIEMDNREEASKTMEILLALKNFWPTNTSGLYIKNIVTKSQAALKTHEERNNITEEKAVNSSMNPIQQSAEKSDQTCALRL